MTTIDRDRFIAKWREQTARVIQAYGKDAWSEIPAYEVLALLDALEQAEARETHHLLCVKNRMRERDEAEARLQAVRDVLDKHDAMVNSLNVPAHRIRRALGDTPA